MKRLLIVDDELGSRESLRNVFSRAYEVDLADGAKAALRQLSEKRFDLVLLDYIMPEMDGLTLLKEVQNLYPGLPFIMVSASPSVRPVVEAMRAGAHDYVSKPFDVEEIRRIVSRTLEDGALRRRVEILQSEVSQEFPVHGIVGQSPAFRLVIEDTRKAAETDATVLIHGESGTGKELIARLLHNLSARKDEPFIAVHCGSLPESLMESELFGHEKGAFTHADKRKLGRFDLAGSGTLFFDEVSEMSPSTQVKLLRVLQEREYMRIGGTAVIRSNARIAAATNRDLLKEMQEKRFREDLFYRLNVVPLHIPPLRERREDIPQLTGYFLQFFARKMNAAVTEITPEAMDRLVRYAWPGNVRELRNIIERLVVLHGKQPQLPLACLPKEFQDEPAAMSAAPAAPAASQATPVLPPGTALSEAVDAYERALVIHALREARGVQTRAAELLGTTRRILKYRMDKLHIDAFDEPAPVPH
jgi:DNA-binding NtrC family response regulator